MPVIDSIYPEFSNKSSKEIVERLDERYYEPLDKLCSNAGLNAIKLKTQTSIEEEKPTTSIYANICLALIEEIKHTVHLRKSSIVPYVDELTKKTIDGHDCANCSTGCAVKHASKIPQIEESHFTIKEMVGRLERVATPLYSDTIHTNIYKTLRNEMAVIQSNLSELFFIEESVLMPKILEEQKSIHARR